MHSLLIRLRPQYALFAEDALRMCVLQVVIHTMFAMERGEAFLDLGVVSLLLYTLLGVACYHLVVRQVVRIQKSELP